MPTPVLDPARLAERLVAIDPIAAALPGAVRIVRAPGRVNLIGEHTDYNEGFVLPIAIDLAISIALVPTDERRVALRLDADGRAAEFDLDAIPAASGGWVDYVAGTAWAMVQAGVPVRGFRGLLASDLPQGAGLSSSAALELASALALSGGEEPPVDRLTLARIAQRAENDYVGVRCGLMDQFASANGVEGAAMLLDCRSLDHRAVPLGLDDVALVVTHSGSERRLEASAYNERRAQCEAAVAAIATRHPAIRSLRDVTPAMLDEDGDRLEPVLARRARHVVEENARVLAAADAFEARDHSTVGRLFRESHSSLRDLYEVSSPELDTLVDIAESVPGVYGSRLTGAGFGGCTVTLVRREATPELTAAIEERYPARTGLLPRVFEVTPAAGAGQVDGWR
ncbi:MAG TPA: galactokinase [Candidatus Limnocylindrales bacterium]